LLLIIGTEFDAVVLVWIVLALVLFPLQLKITAPYGRHMRPGWGPAMSNRLGWVAMESVSLLLFAALFLGGSTHQTAPMWVFFVLWVVHYGHRSLIFPLRARTRNKRIPVLIVASAVLFNGLNAGLNGLYLGTLAAPYPVSWLGDPRFVIGVGLFLAGAIINIWADNRLIALRRLRVAEYTIPTGGLFRYVSCPNHLGEIIEWTGFAVMCWNLPAASFAIWTAANLIPRSLSHHRWYRQRFADYPTDRRAAIPFVL
jgi:3-oxo-5-alpha-steroid 4-dehydrogenase 1